MVRLRGYRELNRKRKTDINVDFPPLEEADLSKKQNWKGVSLVEQAESGGGGVYSRVHRKPGTKGTHRQQLPAFFLTVHVGGQTDEHPGYLARWS